MFGLEAIWRDGQAVGHVRRADFGFTIDKTLAYGYVRDPSGGLVSAVLRPCRGSRVGCAKDPGPRLGGGGPCTSPPEPGLEAASLLPCSPAARKPCLFCIVFAQS